MTSLAGKMNPTILIRQEGSFATIRPQKFLGRDLFVVFRAAIEGSRFDGTRKQNVCALDKVPTIIARLRAADFPVEYDDDLATSLQEQTAQVWVDQQGATERAKAMSAEWAKEGKALYPFQHIGATWLSGRFGALLADEMGLGKSIQTLAALPANAAVLLVVPGIAKGVWLRELRRWRPQLAIALLEGRGNFRWPHAGEVVLMNYDILPKGHVAECTKESRKAALARKAVPCGGCASFLATCPEHVVLVADEAHYLKTSSAQRTVAFRAISDAVRAKLGRTWLLTATPLMNKPQELWSIYQAAGIAQEAFGSWKQFVRTFQGVPAFFGGYEWGTPLDESVERIRRVCLRRLRSEVLPQLPVKTWRHLTVPIDKNSLKLCEKFMVAAGGVEAMTKALASGAITFETMSTVRQALSAAKIPAMLQHVEEYEEQEEPLVVFSAHRGPIDELAKRPGWRVITGDTKPDDRTAIEDAFQRGELKGVGSTIKAGGLAITLTRGAHALFVDLMWNPAENAQAEDRICRIGQTRGCIITVLMANHILDQRVTELLQSKRDLIDAAFGEGGAS